jgi:hypothetical protein
LADSGASTIFALRGVDHDGKAIKIEKFAMVWITHLASPSIQQNI